MDFSTNDYLGLSKSRELLEAAYSHGMNAGVGATGSRILSGNSNLFSELEQQIAKDKKTEAALIMNSGFQTNMTVLAGLLDKSVLMERPIVFFDRLNHSSLYQAIFLSRAELVRYRHCDIEHLSHLIKKYAQDKRTKFIVTETLFGMDGDIPDIHGIIKLARQYNAILYLDEAHATGVLGNNGYGISTDFDLSNITHVIMGTFSKAVGVFGSYIASSKMIRRYLINKCTGFIYSTTLPPMLLGAIAKSWEKIASMSGARTELMAKASRLRMELQKRKYDVGTSATHIIPLILKEEEKTTELQRILLGKGFRVSAVRPPTVPANTSRIRIALCTFHSEEDTSSLVRCMDNKISLGLSTLHPRN
ncbi:aminotransferase class I and II family protein [Neorickettsia helminthoeca str. Oregon]|uniref:5-aminolevulinate synthase n=1 Tax=Neorickettsia helminthoeca str. Oregon TaxID=1286528 RepID=X5HM64_9RICK|nr:aminotransferase class I and II family protein [Neorickettsia helminthoeca str. Oregon]